MLELNNVSKTFGGITALSEVSMRVDAGEVRGLIGPNGAGKTTVINLISGLLTQTAGSLFLDGKCVDNKKANERALLGVARTFQNLRLFQNLSVAQNIDVARISAAASGRDTSALIAEACEEFQLSKSLKEPAQSLSYGHLRRLEIVRALALGPKILLLDEPAAGMNERETVDLAKSLQWVRASSDCAIVVIDHDLKFIMALCEKISVMNMGNLIAEGTPEAISKDPMVIEAYLGSEN